ncbi:uncharacterized protein LOC131218236 [Magnolia sinica]|uniref:uncharacterized protein LOC131218236 n=1 Tax=Magnolia sinica TaxID=86752 RepID=UPI00265A1BE8|nr:uncharacterized protein LOC131218236 [Magnolia sinica]
MGNCRSCETTSVATAKLILHDGKLQEFPYPVKVSHVLQRDPTCFICDSDEMGLDDFVSAIGGDEELKPGQLYFALPLSRLRRPLKAEEMAALAVKASSALMERGVGCGCRPKRVMVGPTDPCRREVDRSGAHARVGGLVVEERKRLERVSGRNFKAKLSAIPE